MLLLVEEEEEAEESGTDFDKAQQKLVLRFPPLFFWYVRQSSTRVCLFIIKPTTSECVKMRRKRPSRLRQCLLLIRPIQTLVYTCFCGFKPSTHGIHVALSGRNRFLIIIYTCFLQVLTTPSIHQYHVYTYNSIIGVYLDLGFLIRLKIYRGIRNDDPGKWALVLLWSIMNYRPSADFLAECLFIF